MKNVLVFMLMIVSITLALNYLYMRGLKDGEQRYKQSHRIYNAFKSAYHFGYADCKEGLSESWEGNEQ